jgi:hypothetical protein
MTTAAVRRYWNRLAQVPCLLTGLPAEIAHCHGGSMVPWMGPHAKGRKLPQFDWLVLPLSPRMHRAEYGGLDYNVRRWERHFGTQEHWLDVVAFRMGVDVWSMAGIDRSTKETA